MKVIGWKVGDFRELQKIALYTTYSTLGSRAAVRFVGGLWTNYKINYAVRSDASVMGECQAHALFHTRYKANGDDWWQDGYRRVL
jgi:hypothetical protein